MTMVTGLIAALPGILKRSGSTWPALTVAQQIEKADTDADYGRNPGQFFQNDLVKRARIVKISRRPVTISAAIIIFAPPVNAL